MARLKVKLVAHGFKYKESVDFEETFAPMVRWNIVQTLIVLVTHNNWDVFHLYVKIAFLSGELEETYK
jgi:hypothetical protein